MRLIDADSLIKEIKNNYCKDCWNVMLNDGYCACRYQDLIEMAQDQPTTINKWVPTSERLPEKESKYLCTRKGVININYLGIYSFSKDLYNVDNYDFAEYKGLKKAGFYTYDSEYGHIEIDYITAWQPLPESYEGE